ncbi:MAG: TetR family transcriptional regulator [Ferrovibrio sp.]|jgi:AcrR family transcriptional regulator|nr:TetR family transcriptional regulator [Ferrovibrio sp.]
MTVAAIRSGTNAEEQNRAEILKAAAIAFMRKGYSAASIDDVADLMNATKGRVYHYYRSKADLFFDVHFEAMRLDLDVVRPLAASGGDPLQRLHAMAVAHILIIMTQLPFQRVAVQGLEMHLAGQTTPEQRSLLARILELRDEYQALFAGPIEEALQAGLIPQQDTRTVVKAFFGALNWTTIWYRPGPEETPERQQAMAEEIATFAIRGLGSKSHG